MMNNKAFTLIELLVGAAIFSLAVTTAAGGFLAVMKLNRQNTANRHLSQTARLITEEISRRIRLADKDDRIEIKNNILGIIGAEGRDDYFYASCDDSSLKISHHKKPCEILSDPVAAGIAKLNPDDIEIIEFTPKLISGLPNYVEWTMVLRSKEQPSSRLTIQTAATKREL